MISLLRPQQEGYFKYITKKIQGSHPVKEEVNTKDEAMEKKYVEAMQELKEVMTQEKLRKR